MTDMTVEHAMQLADLLYRAGYDARHKERDYDPRGCDAWQDVVDALTALSVEAERYRWVRDHDNAFLLSEDVIDDQIAIDKARRKEVQDES
jgi:hypothetical protein